jgi:hypothetical protein
MTLQQYELWHKDWIPDDTQTYIYVVLFLLADGMMSDGIDTVTLDKQEAINAYYVLLAAPEIDDAIIQIYTVVDAQK